MRKWLLAFTAMLVVLPVAIYISLPFLAKSAVESWLLDRGFSNPQFELDYPEFRQLRISQLSAQKVTQDRTSTLEVGPVTVSYEPLTLILEQRLMRVEIPQASLTVELTGEPPANISESSPLDLSLLMPNEWMQLSPAEELVIGQLQLTWLAPTQPKLRFDGNVYLTQTQLLSRVLANVEDKQVVRADVTVSADNRATLALLERNQRFFNSDIELSLHEAMLQTKLSYQLQLQGLARLSTEVAKQYQQTLPLAFDQTRGSLKGSASLAINRNFTGDATQWLKTIAVSGRHTLVASHPQPLTFVGQTQLDAALSHQSQGVDQFSVTLNTATLQLEQIKHEVHASRAIANLTTPFSMKLPVDQPRAAVLSRLHVALNLEQLKYDTTQIRALDASLILENITPTKLSANATLAVSPFVIQSGQTTAPPIGLSGSTYITWPDVKAGLEISLPSIPATGAGAVTYNATSDVADARWRLAEFNLADSAATLLAIFPKEIKRQIPDELKVLSGTYAHHGAFEWRQGRLDGKLHHSLSNLALVLENKALQQAFLSGTTFLRGSRLDQSLKANIDTVAVGTPITDISLDLRLNNITQKPSLDLKHAHLQLLGGSASVLPLFSRLDAEKISASVKISELSLQEILLLEQQPGLTGYGILDGELPLQFTPSGIRVVNGTLATRAPGVVQYKPDASIKALGQQNLGLGVALDALENFHFNHLSAKANYEPDGSLLLTTRIEGANPDWNQGQPVNFSINIEENILKLLETLQFADKLTQQIEKRYR